MTIRLKTGLLAAWLAGASVASAEPIEPLVLTLSSDASLQAIENPIRQTAASSPRNSDLSERPSELPNIDPRLDIKPLVAPSAEKSENKRPHRDRRHSDYDNSLLWLPDRNPGTRQPPCPCLPLGTFWVNTAFFLGKTENDSVPPSLVGGAPGVNLRAAAGNERLDHPFRSGMRLELGSWLDRCQNWGVESSFFFMQATLVESLIASDGSQTLVRAAVREPFDQRGAEVIAGPGVGRGSLLVESPLTFLGADVNSRHNLFCEDNRRFDFLAGYRFARMSESVNLNANTTFLNGDLLDVIESFRTVSNFHGGQIGMAGEYRFDRVYLSGSAKIAFGATWSSLTRDGVTRTNMGGALVETPGGAVVPADQMGRTYFRDFAVVPETNVAVGFQVFEHWRAYVGYTFLYVSSVARPGQALGQALNPAAARGDINSDFWMHGINLGFEARY